MRSRCQVWRKHAPSWARTRLGHAPCPWSDTSCMLQRRRRTVAIVVLVLLVQKLATGAQEVVLVVVKVLTLSKRISVRYVVGAELYGGARCRRQVIHGSFPQVAHTDVAGAVRPERDVPRRAILGVPRERQRHVDARVHVADLGHGCQCLECGAGHDGAMQRVRRGAAQGVVEAVRQMTLCGWIGAGRCDLAHGDNSNNSGSTHDVVNVTNATVAALPMVARRPTETGASTMRGSATRAEVGAADLGGLAVMGRGRSSAPRTNTGRHL